MGNRVSSINTPLNLKKTPRTKSVIFTFEDFGEEAPDDGAIRKAITSLQTAITKHAYNYYHRDEVTCSPDEIKELLEREREGGDKIPILQTEFPHLLCDKRTRGSAIISFIAYMVLKNISFHGSMSHTLLPPKVVEIMQELGLCGPRAKLTEEDEIAFTQWRTVTAHLLTRRRKQQEKEAETHNTRQDMVDRLVHEMDNTLKYFSSPQKRDSYRLESLENIVVKARKAGEMIFASPSRWHFDWKPSRRDLREQDSYSGDKRSPQNHQIYNKNKEYIVMVRFPALLQEYTEITEDNQGNTGFRSRAEYDDTPEVAEALGDIRDRIKNSTSDRPPPPIQQSLNESNLGSSSPSKSEHRLPKRFED